MKTIKLNIKTKTKNYPIYFGDNILNKTGKFLKKIFLILKKYVSLAIINYQENY